MTQSEVSVKALEWGQDFIRNEWHGNVVPGTGYNYLVKYDGRWCVDNSSRMWVLDQGGDVEAAKAAAQADYEARIRSALAPPVEAEPVAWRGWSFLPSGSKVWTLHFDEDSAKETAAERNGSYEPLFTHPPLAAQPPDDVREAFPQVRRALDLVIDLGQYTTVQNSPVLMMAVEAARNAVEVLGAPSPTPPDDVAEGMDWRDDPSADERWNAGLDFAMDQLCIFLGVDPKAVVWDAATEEVEGDVRAVMGNIMRVKFGEDWAPASLHPEGVRDAEHHKLDNARQVFFYEQDFYVLSNFSAFRVRWDGLTFDTSEAAYHWEKFASVVSASDIATAIRTAPSAHEAFKIAERNKDKRRADWDMVKIDIMREILRAKAEQHEYVRRKLLATGDRELIEDSWRDDFWGWGPNRDGQNMLGKLWMEVRSELRTLKSGSGQ